MTLATLVRKTLNWGSSLSFRVPVPYHHGGSMAIDSHDGSEVSVSPTSFRQQYVDCMSH